MSGCGKRLADPMESDPRSVFKMSLLERFFAALIFGPIALGFTVAIFSLLKQVMHYLQSGQWVSVSVIDALRLFHMKWAIQPESWIGLHKLLDSLWLGFGTIILGGGLSLFFVRVSLAILPNGED